MQPRWRCDEHGVEIVALHHPEVIFFALREGRGLLSVVGLDQIHTAICGIGQDVAERRHFYTTHGQRRLQKSLQYFDMLDKVVLLVFQGVWKDDIFYASQFFV